MYIEEFEQNLQYPKEGKPLLTVKPSYEEGAVPKGTMLIIAGFFAFFFAIPLFFLMLLAISISSMFMHFRLPFPEGLLYVLACLTVFILFPPLVKIFAKLYFNNTAYHLHKDEIVYQSSFPIYQVVSLPYANIIGISVQKSLYDEKYSLGIISLETLNKRPMALISVSEPDTIKDIIKKLMSEKS